MEIIGKIVKNSLQSSWILTLGKLSSVVQSALLLIAFATLLACCAPIGWYLHGTTGVIAAVASIGVCAFAGVLALLLGEILTVFTSGQPSNDNGQAAVVSALGPMAVSSFVRLGLPLIACLFVQQQLPHLVEANFAWYLLAAFGLGLMIETLFLAARSQVNLLDQQN